GPTLSRSTTTSSAKSKQRSEMSRSSTSTGGTCCGDRSRRRHELGPRRRVPGPHPPLLPRPRRLQNRLSRQGHLLRLPGADRMPHLRARQPRKHRHLGRIQQPRTSHPRPLAATRPTARTHRVTAKHQPYLIERVVNAAVPAIILTPLLAIAIAGEVIDRLPDPRAVLWLARNLRMRRIT